MVHDVSAEDAEDEDSEREDIHAASWGNGPKAPGRTRTCNHGVPTMRFTKPAYANSATGALRVGSGGQDLHLLAALSLDSSGFYNPPYQAPCLRRIPARTLQACPVNSGRGATLVCSLSSCSACADLASQRVLPRRRPRDGWAAAVSGVWLSQPRIPLAELPASRSSRPGGSYWPDVAGGQNQEYKRAGQALRHPVPRGAMAPGFPPPLAPSSYHNNQKAGVSFPRLLMFLWWFAGICLRFCLQFGYQVRECSAVEFSEVHAKPECPHADLLVEFRVNSSDVYVRRFLPLSSESSRAAMLRVCAWTNAACSAINRSALVAPVRCSPSVALLW
jgi:hypothetical protein